MNKKADPLAEWWTIAAAAREIGVGDTTLGAAIARGEVASGSLGCGRQVVSIESARRWSKNRPKPGPRPRKKADE